ncbi:Armadillo-type fold [Phytophthora cinnamomi]|uniref:Armadillo-type fold n=1 Tax=Phytophthora cinnamomi TaxID=4785 RepID=UPI00355A64F4|nr:Armadillo-type fold [Phytophthora cinnamomi]
MGQAGSAQQKSALRDVLSLRRANVSSTELEEVLRTFCALFPLELQVPVDADPNLLSSVVGVDVKERRLFDVVHGLLQDQTEQSQRRNGRDMTELVLTSFRRVIRWRELYKLCAKCSLKPFLTCLYQPSPSLVLSVLETLELMLKPCPGFEAGDKAADRSEAANRRNFGDSGGFEVLRSLLVQYGAVVGKDELQEAAAAAAVLEGVLKIFQLTLVSRRAATDMTTCSQAVEALMNARVALLDLCHCRDRKHGVMELAIGLVRELFRVVDLDQVHELQESAREYGALLYALATAVREDDQLKTIENGKEVEGEGEGGNAIERKRRELCVDLVEVFCAGNTRSKKAMYRIFPVELFTPAKNHVLSLLAKQHEPGIQAITKNPEVITAMLELASRPVIMQYADIDAASVCLSCLGGLCHYDELRTLVVAAGGLLSLIDTVAFCPAEEFEKVSTAESSVTDDHSESDPSDDGDAEAGQIEEGEASNVEKTSSRLTENDNSGAGSAEEVQRVPSRFFGAIRSAALVLRACLGPKNASTPSLPTQVLYQLLTPSFVRVLRTSPDQFILELQTTEDISTATLIWTVSMRQRLHKCISAELTKVKTAAAAKKWPRWDPEHFVAADSYRYQYPELTDVLVLHDVYLANFVATPAEDLDLGDIDMASFSEALLISIQSHENVLRILQERGSNDPTKEAAIRLMRQAMDKLVSKHPQHNLEVDASRGVLLSDGSPAVSPTAPNMFSPETLAAVNSFSPTDDRDWDITRIERCSSSGIEDLTV